MTERDQILCENFLDCEFDALDINPDLAEVYQSIATLIQYGLINSNNIFDFYDLIPTSCRYRDDVRRAILFGFERIADASKREE